MTLGALIAYEVERISGQIVKMPAQSQNFFLIRNPENNGLRNKGKGVGG